MKAKDFLPSRLEMMTDRVPIVTSWQWIVNFIKGDALRNNTAVYRQRLAELEAADDPAERKAIKDQLAEIKRRTGGFLPHASFVGGRLPEHVADVSNHVMVDLDHIDPDDFADVRRRLREWDYTFLLYTTYSGRGLRAIVRVEGDYTARQFRRVWTMVNDRVEQLCGVKADRQCGDITRFSGLAHDPDVVYNPQAKLLDLVRSEHLLVSSEKRVVSSEKLLTNSFDDLVKRIKGMVEANGCYYREGNHNNYIAQCMYLMNKFGVSQDDAMAWGLREFSDYNASSVRSTVRSCYRHVSEHGSLLVSSEKRVVSSEPLSVSSEKRVVSSEERRGMREERVVSSEKRVVSSEKRGGKSGEGGGKSGSEGKGSPARQSSPKGRTTSPHMGGLGGRATPTDIRSFLDGVASFRLNVVSGQTEVKWSGEEEWNAVEDRDVASLWMRMSEQDMRTTTQTIRDVIDSDFTPKFNPFASYFESLPEWDGDHDHLADLADRIHLVGETDDERQRLRQAVRRWIVAMVAGIMEPQTINHEILVLLGKQGNYKSTFFALLLPPELQRYFYARLTVMSKDKDDLLSLSQYALIAYEEIDCLSPSALNHLKAEVTMRTVNERQAYRHFKECRPHIASFCATGNNVNFLTDSTGNRRWLAFEVETIDSPIAHPFDYRAIYSQAWTLYRRGEKYWYDGEEIDLINRRNEHFSAPCLEEELVDLYYSLPGDIMGAKLVSTAEILERINAGMKMPLSATKIGMVMKRLGYEKTRTRSGAKYRVHERTPQEIDDARRAEIAIADRDNGKQANVQTELPF